MSPDPADPPATIENPDGSVETMLPADLGSVRIARHWVQTRWDDVEGSVLDDVALIVTELVANAVRHGRPDILFRVRVEPFAVDVAVLDHGPDLPPARPLTSGEEQPGGRGLTLVNGLAHEWGVAPLPDGQVGKTVWATVSR